MQVAALQCGAICRGGGMDLVAAATNPDATEVTPAVLVGTKAESARHVTGCHYSQELMCRNEFDDLSIHIHLSLPPLHRTAPPA